MGDTGKIRLTEVGLRDGLQREGQLVPTEEKVRMARELMAAGVARLQITAMVHPQKVPQMADAEDLIARLAPFDGILASALVLNLKGARRASATGLPAVEVSLSASDDHSRANTGLSLAQARGQIKDMIDCSARAGQHIRASIQCAFGFKNRGDTPMDLLADLSAQLLDRGVDELVLADTTGLAAPPLIREMLDRLLPICRNVPVGLHLHDTRGLGLVNLAAALDMGVTRFDTAFGGLGGCPFIDGAAGNIATEDTAYLLAALGRPTGIDIGAVSRVSRRLSRFLQKPLPGKLYRLMAP